MGGFVFLRSYRKIRNDRDYARRGGDPFKIVLEWFSRSNINLCMDPVDRVLNRHQRSRVALFCSFYECLQVSVADRADTYGNQARIRKRELSQEAIGGFRRTITMFKVNADHIEELSRSSPKAKFVGFRRLISEALGRRPLSTDLMERHPFDVEILRVPPGKMPYPYHAHSAQWEFYHVISGGGTVRHEGGLTMIDAGDAFIFPPDQAHQLINDREGDLLLYIVADNPVGESCYYPDSKKWGVRSPKRTLLRSEVADYYDGEE